MSNESIAPLSLGADQTLYSMGGTTLGKEDFLKLLITQLQYQDPLSPLNNQEFMAELAQFSSLEQLQNVNSNLQTSMLLSQSLNNSSATNLIGKRVISLGNQVYLSGEGGEEITFDLAEDAGVTIEIYDEEGNLIRTLKGGSLPGGRNQIHWDGEDGEGNQLPPGNYSFKVIAVDSESNVVDVTTYSTGLVEGVRFKEGNAVLILGDEEINLSDIVEVLRP